MFGVLKAVSIDTPSPYSGTDVAQTSGDWVSRPVPLGKVWQIRELTWRAKASAVASNRIPVMRVLTSGGLTLAVGTPNAAAFTANQEVYLHLIGVAGVLIQSAPTQIQGNGLNCQRTLWVPPGGLVMGTLLAPGAGDTQYDVNLVVVEYDEKEAP